MAKKVKDEELIYLFSKYNRMSIRKSLVHNYVGNSIGLSVWDPKSEQGKRRESPFFTEARWCLQRGFYKYSPLSDGQTRVRLRELAEIGQLLKRGRHWDGWFSMTSEWLEVVIQQEVDAWLKLGVPYTSLNDEGGINTRPYTEDMRNHYDSSEFLNR